MDHFLTSTGVAVAALFPVVDPIGITPWFMSATRGRGREWRHSQVLKASIVSFLMIAAFLLFGRFVLDFFDVSIAAVEFVGGLVIGVVGWEMLTQPPKTEDEDEGEGGSEADGEHEEIFFSPLAFPLLAGPGALAISLGLTNRHDHALDYLGFVLGIAVVVALSYVILTRAEHVLKRIGPRGVDVINRIMGLIVLAIAAELVFHGIADHFALEIVE